MDQEKKTEPRKTKAELIERIQRSYENLEDTLRPLSDAQLSRPGPSQWAVKDHLTHLTAWELGIVELLQHRPRFTIMQVDDAVKQGKSEDQINDLIYQRNASLTPQQTLEQFRSAYRQLLAVLDGLDDEDLYKPYNSYLPEGIRSPGSRREEPVIDWIVGNTFGHFDEHNGWIQEILEGHKA
jgi:hypothetical protein